MKIEIRRAKPDETAILTDLSMRSKRSNGYDDAFMDACREELTVTVERIEGGEYWVADAGVIYGCVCLGPYFSDTDSAQINAFFIDPDWQRKGIGRLLWAKILERAAQRGIIRLTLDADPAAVAFYQAMGFETIGETPSGSIPGRVIPQMAIQLI
ncbi:MAG: GNAT family N-acetyltransferase [Hyphomicrobiales bacterium]|nr:MAG: GNAT family N-acetyltransferase [Hyphomicrobiales bacterium]